MISALGLCLVDTVTSQWWTVTWTGMINLSFSSPKVPLCNEVSGSLLFYLWLCTLP